MATRLKTHPATDSVSLPGSASNREQLGQFYRVRLLYLGFMTNRDTPPSSHHPGSRDAGLTVLLMALHRPEGAASNTWERLAVSSNTALLHHGNWQFFLRDLMALRGNRGLDTGFRFRGWRWDTTQVG